jgi:beta-lactamase class A
MAEQHPRTSEQCVSGSPTPEQRASGRGVWSRRAALSQAAASLVWLAEPGWALAAPGGKPLPPEEPWAALEERSQGRLGIAVIDTGSGRRFGHRQAERFPLCSTFKVLVAAAALARVDRGEEQLDRRLAYTEADLLEHAPVTRANLARGGLTLSELCAAAVMVSDNTAANLLLATLGGPAGLTAYARTLGDASTRLDRIEPALNEAKPGDDRDTTTPGAMAEDLRVLLLGEALKKASREQLAAWMVASTTGLERLRAGFPAGVRVADKTGTGENGTSNDVAVLWPPERKPVIVAAYLTGSKASPAVRNATLAGAARAAWVLLAHAPR